MAQLSRARDRSMHSIVATIQAEQDQAIRAPGKGVVSISGGPGTGKTVVALHRAAYLLYTDRRRYEGGGVLIVGPSGVFMRYIERVLPCLGETAVALRSLGEVVDGVRATRHDEPAVADVKGSARMAELMRRTVAAAGARQPDEFRIFWRDDVIVLDRGLLGRLRRQLMSQGRRNRQLPRSPPSLLDAMWRQVRGERGRERGREAFNDEMLSNQAFVDFAVAVVAAARRADGARLAARPRVPGPGRRGRASRAEDQRLLTKSWDARGRRCSVEDVPLLDELRYALGDVPARTEDDHELDDHCSRAVDLQELTTAVGPRVRARPAAAWTAAHAPRSRTTASPTCSSTRRRTSRRCSGGWSAGAAARRPGRSSATRRSRRGRCPSEAAAARAAALEGKELHEFHLSTNYRNSVGDLRVRRGVRRAGRPRRRPARPPSARPASSRTRSPASPTSRRPPARRSPTSPGRVARHRRHRGAGRPPLRGQRLAGLLARARRRRPGRPRRRRLLGRRRRARTGRRAHRPRHQGPGVRRHRRGPARRRSRPSRPPAAPPSTSCSPAPPSCSPPSADAGRDSGGSPVHVPADAAVLDRTCTDPPS